MQLNAKIRNEPLTIAVVPSAVSFYRKVHNQLAPMHTNQNNQSYQVSVSL